MQCSAGARVVGPPVKGQDEVLSGGLVTSREADSRNPCWWAGDLQDGQVKAFTPLPARGLLEAVGVALGDHGRNAKLQLTVVLAPEERVADLYLHPQHRRSPRRVAVDGR